MTENNSSTSATFVWMSDIHYDPFYGTPDAYHASKGCFDGNKNNTNENGTVVGEMGKFHCDAPWNLVESAFRHVATTTFTTIPPPEFVLLTGDFSRHGLDEIGSSSKERLHVLWTLLVRSMNQLAQDLKKNMDVLFVLGNNDALRDYYIDISHVTNEDNPLHILSSIFEDNNILSSQEAASFRRGGYYSRAFPQQNLVILCLNTVIYSIRHQPPIPNNISDPLGQFAWMESILESVHHKYSSSSQHQNHSTYVYIVGHIPPIVDSYGHEDMWHDPYRSQYLNLIRKYRSIVRSQLFGHFHTSEFRLAHDGYSQDNDDNFILLAPAVTPVYNNNPAFYVMHYDPNNGDLLDLDTHIYNISSSLSITSQANISTLPGDKNWTKLKSWSEEYQIPNLSPSNIYKGIVEPILDGNDDVLSKFLLRYKSGIWAPRAHQCFTTSGPHVLVHDFLQKNHTHQTYASCSRLWYCTLTSNTRAHLFDCLGTSHGTMEQGKAVFWSGLVLSVALLIIGIVGASRARRELLQHGVRYTDARGNGFHHEPVRNDAELL